MFNIYDYRGRLRWPFQSKVILCVESRCCAEKRLLAELFTSPHNTGNPTESHGAALALHEVHTDIHAYTGDFLTAESKDSSARSRPQPAIQQPCLNDHVTAAHSPSCDSADSRLTARCPEPQTHRHTQMGSL